MDPMDLVREIAAVDGRSACTDAERRAARLLARRLRALGRPPRTETFWVRPAWGWVHALLATAGIVASVVAVDHAVVATAIVGAALLLFMGDLSGRLALLRRLTAARATQNLVSQGAEERRVTLIVTAAIDAPVLGAGDRGALARLQARLRRLLRGHLPGPLGLTAFALTAVLAACVARLAGVDATWLGALQLVPSVVLILVTGHFLDAALGRPGPGAGSDASAAAVAVALVAALDGSPPRNLGVDLVLAGAGGPHALGMRRHVRALRRAGTRPEDVCVLHVHACGAGSPVWWTREGLVFAARYHPRLLAIAQDVARDEAHLNARPHESRSASGARAARAAGWPAIAIGCVDEHGVAPRAGEQGDTADLVDPRALRGALELGLALVHRLDADLATQRVSERRSTADAA